MRRGARPRSARFRLFEGPGTSSGAFRAPVLSRYETATVLPALHGALFWSSFVSRLDHVHVVDMVFHWARIDPHRPAIVLPELVTTFAGLADAVDSISNRIDQLGLDPREPVATAIGNPALSIAVVFALLRSGFNAVPANRPLIKHLQPNG